MKFLKHPVTIFLLCIALVFVALASYFFWPKRIWTLAHINPHKIVSINVMQVGPDVPHCLDITDPDDVKHIIDAMSKITFVPARFSIMIIDYSLLNFMDADGKTLGSGTGFSSDGKEIWAAIPGLYYRAISGSLLDDPIFRKYVDPNGVYSSD